MAHNIDMSNNRANIAFRGSRRDVWHRLGQEMQPGMSVDEWAKAAGLDWTALKVPALADKRGIGTHDLELVPDRFFNVRSDTGYVLGFMSDRYMNVQPRDVLAWFERYVSVDPRFELDVAGSLKSGEIIWATATFNGDTTIAGEKHTARLLMSTTFDGSGATTNQATITRVVCNNTLNAAQFDKRAVIRTRHSTQFKPATVAKELAAVAQSFEVYKLMGDALAQAELSREAVADFFKDCLDIPRDAQPDDISTRKANQYQDVARAYHTTIAEGAQEGTAWATLQAITRYVDHDRSTRNGNGNEDEARFTSATFGSGQALKGKAMELLLPRIKDKVPALVR
jgi:phage/plasmid-like protein (TIGR03299 family)